MTRPILTAIALLAALSGCGPAFHVQTPREFVELDAKHRGASDFEYRATSAQGVVIAVRIEKNEGHGALAFWSEAVKNRLVRGGYAIVAESDVRAKSGEAGHQFRAGRDEAGRTYEYWVTVFRTDAKVFVVEAGGRRDRFEPAKADVEAAIASFRIR